MNIKYDSIFSSVFAEFENNSDSQSQSRWVEKSI